MTNKGNQVAGRAEGALILHIVLLYYGPELQEEQVQLIIKSTLNALNDNPAKPAYRAK